MADVYDYLITVDASTTPIDRQFVDISMHSGGGEPYILGDDWILKVYLGTDVSSDNFWFTLKANPTDPDPGVRQKIGGSGIAFTTDDKGILVTLAATDRSSLVTYAGKNLYYDVQWKPASGSRIITVCMGKLHVYQDVTTAVV